MRPNDPLSAVKRFFLWLCCLCASVTLFSLLFSFGGLQLVVLRVTAMFAVPVWLLYVPLIMFLHKPAPGFLLSLVGSGIVVGPALLALLGLVQQLRGGDKHLIWLGDGIDIGLVPCIICAAIVGFLTTAFYAIVWTAISFRDVAARGTA